MCGGSRRGDLLQPLGGAAREADCRLARRQVGDGHVAPENAVPQSRAERLGAGLLGGEALGVRSGARRTAFGFGLFGFRENAVNEALAITLERFFDAADVDEIGAEA